MSNSTASISADYARVADAIAFLRAEHTRQPELSAVAAHLGLSESRVQRLFSRWAGISPKRFVQYLSVEYAKRCMAETGDLLALAHRTGLSGPGRLHDLFVAMEALSPGEFRRAAAGVPIDYGVHPSPFGDALIAHTPRGICHLSFIEAGARGAAVERLRARWPSAELRPAPQASATLLEGIFHARPEQVAQGLSLWVSGSNFQIQVWRALLAIPPGRLLNYAQLADLIGRPRAARAVGTAIAANPIAFLIPCHRVLRASGDIGLYHWGSERKAALVAWEAARARTR